MYQYVPRYEYRSAVTGNSRDYDKKKEKHGLDLHLMMDPILERKNTEKYRYTVPHTYLRYNQCIL